MRLFVLFVAFLWQRDCLAHKILLFPSPFYSHSASVYAIGKEFMEKGHEVHMLQHWSFKLPDQWTSDGKMVVYRYGKSDQGSYHVEDYVANLTKEYLLYNHGFEFYLSKMQILSKRLVVDMLTDNDDLIERLKIQKFDIAVVDSVFFMRFSCLVPHQLGVPMVTYSDSINPWLVRMPWLPSIFSPMRMSTDSHNGFWKRVSNLLTVISFKLFPLSLDLDKELLDKYRQFGDFQSIEDLISRSVLFLVPGDPVLDVVRPSTANVVFVGGLTTDLFRQALPVPLDQTYLNFISDPKTPNVVLVSFGSMVYWYPQSLAKLFIETFKLMPELKFIWKFPNEYELEVPSNVMVVKWMPQKELLNRSEIKLFVTHSGNNGQFEAVYHGVPMLAVPLFTDQIRNAKRIVERGYGEQIDYRTSSPEDFARSIRKIISDPSYKIRIKKASSIFRDQPQTPSQRAAFWIDHVIKYGADHLKPTGNDLYFWQYLCIDILFLFIAVLGIALFLTTMLTKVLLAKLCKSGKTVQASQKKLK